MDKMKMRTPDLTDENIERLAALFPNVITETKDESGSTKKAIDFDFLRQVLSKDIVEGDDERYRLDWPGKKASLLKANMPITKTLRPCREESVNFDTTGNLYIEGDNFEVLKILQESYLGKVKIIYIDPPYNTGNDFIYKDDFAKSKEDYEEEIGVEDEEGGKLFRNTDSNGRFHSDWLSMMYERIVVAKDILKDDGVIFISIGVEEIANLKEIMDEVFGEANFIEIFSWVKTSTPPALSIKSRKTNEYILCYEKSWSPYKYKGELLDGGDQPLLNSGNSERILKFPCDKVLFNSSKFPNGNYPAMKPDRVELFDSITIKDGYATQDFRLKGEFKWTQDFLDEEIKKGTKFIIKSDILSIRFIRDEEGYKRPTNFIKAKYTTPVIDKKSNLVGTNENATSELSDLMGTELFSYPKPVSLIKHLVNFTVDEGDIVLDFFSGSGTTAEAIFNLIIDENIKLRFILVQLPENLDENLAKAGSTERKTLENGIAFLNRFGKPHFLTELAKERIRRAGKKAVEELNAKNNQLQLGEDPVDATKLDIGFRVYKTDDTNMKDVFYHPAELNQKKLAFLESNIKEDRTPEDLLTQVILDLGLELSLPIETKRIGKNTVFIVQTNALVACFDNDIDFKIVDSIANLKPFKVVFKDASFKNDKDRINAEERFKRLSPETKVTVI
jgi:adenine-specific DNA-methyltransferase